MIASVFASTFGMFTALRTSPLISIARICCATSMPTFSCASAVLAPRCGVRTMFGSERSGKSAGGGSTSYTSSAAAATWRLFSASYSAFSSMSPPRAQLMIRTPFFVFASRSALSMFFVSSVSGMCIVM